MKCREKGKFERAIKLKKGLEDYANRKGDSEITIPTYQGMEIVSARGETKIVIISTTGKITIKCYQHHLDHGNEKDA